MLHNNAENRRPLFASWFGTLFEPYYSDFEAAASAIDEMRALGINCVVLDSKLWREFSEFFRDGTENHYVAMQRRVINRCRDIGMGVSFLALYHNGDNLWPKLHDSPPEFIDPPVDLQGQSIRGYRHWSDKQLNQQIQHCLDLYRHLAGPAAATALDENGQERLPFYFYHDPIFIPSFDRDGIDHYLGWLEQQYSLDELNRRYGTEFDSIRAMRPEDYWVHPEKAGNLLDAPCEEDYREKSKRIPIYADNQRFKRWVMKEAFRKLSEGLKQQEPRFYLYSALNQWKLFFNDCDPFWYWDTSRRGVDIWDLGDHLDCPSFTVGPSDCYAEPDAYVVSCELAMLRSATRPTDFIAGLYMGRYLRRDVYNVVSPAEVIATAFAAGATDLYFYGYGGLDDGGSYDRWPIDKKASLKRGLDFFAEVREIAGPRKLSKKAAIVFPLATYVLQHAIDNWQAYAANRNDTLGWYRQLADLGVNCDVLHPRQIAQGMLAEYELAIMPANPLYWAMPDADLARQIEAFVRGGGLLLRSASAGMDADLAIEATDHERDSIAWREKMSNDSPAFKSFENGECVAAYMRSGKTAIARHAVGEGSICSFGFNYGYACTVVQHTTAHKQYGIEDHYPLSLMQVTPVEKILMDAGLAQPVQPQVERVDFANGRLIINHSSCPVWVAPSAHSVCTIDSFNGTCLSPHSTCFSGLDR